MITLADPVVRLWKFTHPLYSASLTPSMRIQRTALAASALRQSSAVSPNHAWLGKASSLFCVQPRATGLPDKAKGCRSGWGTQLSLNPSAAQQSPSVTFPQPRSTRPPSTHICADSDWSWGCSIALGEMDGDPTPPLLWMETGLLAVRLHWKSICALRETQIAERGIDSQCRSVQH